MKKHLPDDLIQRIISMSRFFFFALCLQTLAITVLFAKGSNAQSKSIYEIGVTINFTDTPVLEIFKEIEKETDFNFSFNSEAVDNNLQVTFHGETTVGLLLEEVSRQTNLMFKRVDDNIHVSKRLVKTTKVVEVIREEFKITGQVLDEDEIPLPGATVLEKGTKNGTSTDAKGNFTLEVNDESATLLVSFIGYASQEVPVNGQSNITVRMVADISSLEEVVVIGYGTQKKGDLTGSIVSMKSEDLQTGALNSVDKQLSGKASGVMVTQTSGQPGAGTTIRIRGTNSILGNNEPLYVIDGVPYGNPSGGGNTFSSNQIGPEINPNDIASIQILKDASATAIYGSRGANGVILITTKSGSAGKPKLTVESYYGIATLSKKLDLLDAQGIAQVHRTAIDNGVTPVFDPDTIVGPGTDWQDEVYRTAGVKNIQVAVSGGNENLNYMFSGNVLDEDGIVLNSGYKRYGLRANIESRINDKIMVGVNLYGSKSAQNPAGGTIGQTIVANPIYPVKDAGGQYTVFTDPNSRTGNPVATSLLEIRDNNTTSMLSNFFAEYQLMDNLVVRSRFGANVSSIKNNFFAPPETLSGRTANTVANINTKTNLYWVSNSTVTYSKTMGENFFDVMVGFVAEKNHTENFSVNSSNYVTDYSLFHSLESAQILTGASDLFENQLASFIGRTNFNYHDRFLITFSGRYDGSSNFGASNRWAFFPSGALAWKVSNESFMQGLEAVRNVKLRASVGVSGEQAINSYQTLQSLSTNQALFAGNLVRIGYIPNRLPNPDLKWEKTAQYNLGMDATLEPLRLNLTVDAYYKKTTDLLYNRAIPKSTGYGSVLSNVGSMENKGIEITISTENTRGSELEWTTDFNISFNRNKILELGIGPDGEPIKRIINPAGQVNQYGFLPSQYALIVGQPVGGSYGYIYGGTYKSAEEVAEGFEPTKLPGDPRYLDLDGDSLITEDDRMLISNPNPDFMGGMINSFRYKNFDLSIFLQFVYGNELFNLNHFNLSYIDGVNNNASWALDAWTPDNPTSNIPRPGWDNRTNGVSTFHVEDASFLRARNITLGYTIPFPKSKIERFRVYCSVDNVFTITNYTGYTPDVSSNGTNTVSGGFDDSVYPLARTVLFGIKVEF